MSEFKTPTSHERMFRHTVAARVASMESEKLYLQNLHGDISRLRLSIGDRIAALNRQLLATNVLITPSLKEEFEQDKKRLDWVEAHGVEIGISALAYHEISATREAIDKGMREIRTRAHSENYALCDGVPQSVESK